MAGKFLTLEEAASRLGVSIDEINRLVDRKELFPMRDGATIKFKIDEIERLVADLGLGAAGSDELSLGLELSTPGLGSSLSGGGASGADLVLGEPVDEASIFADGAETGSRTIVRDAGEAALGSGPFDIDDLSVESIVAASSPSVVGGSAPIAAESGTMAIDLADVSSLLAGGSGPSLSAESGPGGSLAGAIDSGLSLEGRPLGVSGIDLETDLVLGAAPGSSVESLGGELAGEAFELGAEVGDEESASVVIPTEETGDSSFFGASIDDSASVSFGDVSVSRAAPIAAAAEFEMTPAAPPFSVWQVVGLISCTLLLFVGGLVVFDVLATVRAPQGSPITSPLLTALADTFGW